MTSTAQIVKNIFLGARMIIAVASTKGGTGKSTAALQVALYLLVQKKAKVCLVDADVQGSSNLAIQSREKNLVSPKLRTEVITDGREILNRVPKLNEKYEYVVIDVGGRETDALRASMAICDTLLIPCRPTGLDLLAFTLNIRDVIQKAREEAGAKFKAYVFISQAHTRMTKNDHEVVQFLRSLDDIKYVDAKLTTRVVFEEAGNHGLSVYEMKPRNEKACAEVRHLVNQTVLAK